MNNQEIENMAANNLPEGVRASTTTGYATLIQICDAILSTQHDNRSEIAKSAIGAKHWIVERLKISDSVPAFNSACQDTLNAFLAGPMTELFRSYQTGGSRNPSSPLVKP